MTGTTVILTGTGSPRPAPGRAGASVVVRAEGVALQFDAGRAVALRWADAGLDVGDLTAIFLTHHHSDHLSGLADLVFASWEAGGPNPMPVVAPLGPSARFAGDLLEPWGDDLAVRMQHVEGAHLRALAAPDVRAFAPRRQAVRVWEEGDVVVDAGQVRHEPVLPAVGYRVETPAGSVAISGDTVVCEEMEELARSSDVLVHEAIRGDVLRGGNHRMRRIAEYHSDSVALGGLAQRAGVRLLVLTHLLPAPTTAAEEAAFEADVRRGGFEGPVVVGRDLTSINLEGNGRAPTVAPGIDPVAGAGRA